MARIGFIGVGNMGGPMVCNLIKAGSEVTVFDLLQERLDEMAEEGAIVASSSEAAAKHADVVITMLPAGRHVMEVYGDEIFGNITRGTLLIDCSTIDVVSSRSVHTEAEKRGFAMVDAPVSGGVGGAAGGTLTFMVGGSKDAFDQAHPILEVMGKNIVHCGDGGAGQAAKVCNNMMLGIQMASVAEGFVLAEKLGLDAQKLFDVASTASGQCWSLTTYCPVPGPVATSPANRDYQPGFATALMLKDMKLSLEAAKSSGADLTLANAAESLYQHYLDNSKEEKDFSGVINLIREQSSSH